MKNESEDFMICRKDLISLICYARRYADGKSTSVPFDFNRIYDVIIEKYPEFIQIDLVDKTLTEYGRYFPYATSNECRINNRCF